jgi:hypothetical protein
LVIKGVPGGSAWLAGGTVNSDKHQYTFADPNHLLMDKHEETPAVDVVDRVGNNNTSNDPRTSGGPSDQARGSRRRARESAPPVLHTIDTSGVRPVQIVVENSIPVAKPMVDNAGAHDHRIRKAQKAKHQVVASQPKSTDFGTSNCAVLAAGLLSSTGEDTADLESRAGSVHIDVARKDTFPSRTRFVRKNSIHRDAAEIGKPHEEAPVGIGAEFEGNLDHHAECSTPEYGQGYSEKENQALKTAFTNIAQAEMMLPQSPVADPQLGLGQVAETSAFMCMVSDASDMENHTTQDCLPGMYGHETGPQNDMDQLVARYSALERELISLKKENEELQESLVQHRAAEEAWKQQRDDLHNQLRQRRVTDSFGEAQLLKSFGVDRTSSKIEVTLVQPSQISSMHFDGAQNVSLIME